MKFLETRRNGIKSIRALKRILNFQNCNKPTLVEGETSRLSNPAAQKINTYITGSNSLENSSSIVVTLTAMIMRQECIMCKYGDGKV